MIQRKNIGILGGSFNPPHEGHLQAGLLGLSAGLHEIWYMPNAMPSVGKKLSDYAPLTDRLQMIALMLEGYQNLKVSPIQEDSAMDLWPVASAVYPNDKFFIVRGADCLNVHDELPEKHKSVLRKAPVALVARPGFCDVLSRDAAAIMGKTEIEDPEDFLASESGMRCVGSFSTTCSSEIRRDIDNYDRKASPIYLHKNFNGVAAYIKKGHLYGRTIAAGLADQIIAKTASDLERNLSNSS